MSAPFWLHGRVRVIWFPCVFLPCDESLRVLVTGQFTQHYCATTKLWLHASWIQNTVLAFRSHCGHCAISIYTLHSHCTVSSRADLDLNCMAVTSFYAFGLVTAVTRGIVFSRWPFLVSTNYDNISNQCWTGEWRWNNDVLYPKDQRLNSLQHHNILQKHLFLQNILIFQIIIRRD